MKRMCMLLLVLVLCVSMFCACGKEEDASLVVSEAGMSSTEQDGYASYRLACIYPQITGGVWGVAYHGCVAALEELKTAYEVDGYCVAPEEAGDADLQKELLKEAKAQQVDGILLGAANADSIGTYLSEQFDDEELPIISIGNINTESPAVVLQYKQDVSGMAQAQADMLYQRYGQEAASYILFGAVPQGKEPDAAWLDFIEYCGTQYPQYENKWEDAYWKAETQTSEILRDVQAMVVGNIESKLCLISTQPYYNEMLVTALAELPQEQVGNVCIIGWGFTQREMELIQDGVMYGAVGQDMYQTGYFSVYMLCDYLSGKVLDTNAVIFYETVTKDTIQTDRIQAYLKRLGLA